METRNRKSSSVFPAVKLKSSYPVPAGTEYVFDTKAIPFLPDAVKVRIPSLRIPKIFEGMSDEQVEMNERRLTCAYGEWDEHAEAAVTKLLKVAESLELEASSEERMNAWEYDTITLARSRAKVETLRTVARVLREVEAAE